jgi:hypothetical protein
MRDGDESNPCGGPGHTASLEAAHKRCYTEKCCKVQQCPQGHSHRQEQQNFNQMKKCLRRGSGLKVWSKKSGAASNPHGATT